MTVERVRFTPRSIGPRSIGPDDRQSVVDASGRRASQAHVAQSERLVRRLYPVGEHAWSLVGNGLSNQSFVRGPDGIIAIDSGESVQEMRAAIAELRTVTDAPIVAVLLTHFHYVGGTAAVLEEVAATRGDDAAAALPVWGHAAIDANRARIGGEIAPAYLRGAMEQFGLAMPADGEDGLVNVGLGLAYRNPEHAPSTEGYVAPTHTFDAPGTIAVAGLEIEVTPAPSDADDSVTYWFPALGLAVHNLVWPALFNVFAIRGEEYRDPRVLVRGIDHLRGLEPDHLVCTHGPPMSGREEIARRVTRVRDAIQFLWDQTVRWTNRGATGPELAHLVVLPEIFGDDFLTSELYGIVEHHTRQIRAGLFGFFDGDPAQLLPLAPSERSARMLEAMGGADAVRSRAAAALDADDVRWALELAAILVADASATEEDRRLLADVLRTVARRTPAANIRNWCITRARDLDGSGDLSRFRTHRFSRGQVLTGPVDSVVHVLRVLVEPDRLTGVDLHLAVVLDGERTGIHLRNHVAVPTDGSGATATLSTTRAVWADLLSGRTTLTAALGEGAVEVDGDGAAVVTALGALDLPGFAAAPV
ncbi:MAG TPA: alkyl sulfatase dimerization domain-containing protein [Acidimicrobiia bacterium]|nr:alkyl sulfatase dimerization domain-containing protein [Acidimicrobiia bacterium]